MCIVKELPDMSEEATAEKSQENTDEEKKDQSTNNTTYSATENV